MSLVAPPCFVFARSMLEIQHRVSQLALIVSRWRVHENSSQLTRCFREVPFGAHRAVRNILDGKKVRLRGRHFQPADFFHGREKHPASRVVRSKSIHGNLVVVKARQQRLRSDFPEAVLAFHHVISGLAQLHEQLHFLRLVSSHSEGRAQIRMDERILRARNIGGRWYVNRLPVPSTSWNLE